MISFLLWKISYYMLLLIDCWRNFSRCFDYLFFSKQWCVHITTLVLFEKYKKKRERESERGEGAGGNHIIEFLWEHIDIYYFIQSLFFACQVFLFVTTFNRNIFVGRNRLRPPSLSQRVMSLLTIMCNMIWMMSLRLSSHCGFFFTAFWSVRRLTILNSPWCGCRTPSSLVGRTEEARRR